MGLYIEFEEGQKYAKPNADTSSNPNHFKDCGWLIEDDEIVVDIDHLPKESIKAMLDMFQIRTQVVWTDRGCHLYFKKPQGYRKKQDGVCWLGFSIEQHTKKSRPTGITIKRNGVMRTIENEGKRELLPDILTIPNKKLTDLTGLEDGDSRNKNLYKHTIAVAGHEQADDILRFVNKWVFAEPLEDKEFQTATRDRNTKSTVVSEKVDIAKEVVKKYKTVDYGGLIWFYCAESDKYVADAGYRQLEKIIYRDYDQDATFTKSILDQIKGRSKFVEDGTIFPIRVNNGIIHKGKFIPFDDYTEFTPYRINIDYVATAQPVQIVDDYIDNLTNNDPCYRDLLMEIIGYVMITEPIRINSLAKFFFFRGDGANGKSTLFNIMRRIYGKENCTNISIKQITDPRYNVTMIGKLANLGDDLEPDAINNDQMKMLKNITTADSINTRHLYAESMPTVITTKLYFTTNSEIKSWEKGYAFQRRVLWLPMFNKVEKPDPNFVEKITTKEALEYWLMLIVEGYKRLYNTGKWTSCEMVNEFNESYHINNNPMGEFVEDLEEENVLDCTIGEIKDKFYQWTSDDTAKFSSKLFKQAIWDKWKIGFCTKRFGTTTKRVAMRQAEAPYSIAP